MADLDVLVRELHGTGVPLPVDAYAEVVDDAECEAAVRPGLGAIAYAALLRAEEQEGLDGGDGADALAELLKDHAARVLAEEGAAIVELFEFIFCGRVASPPADGVGEDCVHEGVGVVWP